jgi:hypothetical protein
MSGATTCNGTFSGVPTITLEEHGPPIVRVLGVTLRRAAAQPKLAKRMDRMKGTVALRSTTDPQAATIRFEKGAVRIEHGVHPDADVVISADLNTMGRPGAPSPKVKGAARHLGLALGVAKVLDPPLRDGWQGALDEFWTWASSQPGAPGRLRVVCTDDGADKVVTGPGQDNVELHGPAWVLTSLFTGGDHLAAAVLENRLKIVADMPALSRFTGVVTRYMFGDW